MRKIDYLVVHCTATPEGKWFDEADIERMHATRFALIGGKHIGYHVLILLDGTVIQTKGTEYIGQHVKGYNANSIAICYVGGLDRSGKAKDTRTIEQKKALREVLHELKREYPTARILGHRDLSPDQNGDGIIQKWERIKECPCFDAIPEYSNI